MGELNIMATDKNDKMNALLRANAPITASDPTGKATDDATNSWFRSSVRDAQDARFANTWLRLMSAHAKNVAWENGEPMGDSDNGNA